MGRVSDSKYVVMAGWDDAPHLDTETKTQLLAETPPHLRDARSKGIPSMGSGAIYPVALSEVQCDPFPIPDHWRRAYALDVGWNRTACLWFAEDPAGKTLYVYGEYYKGQAVPGMHAMAIKARGEWIPGAVDPASRGRSQHDGAQLFTEYVNLGLHLHPADNGVDAGIYAVWQALELGQLKLFKNLQYLPGEYRLYRRDEKGHIVKKHDHLMDCLRYGKMSFNDIAKPLPPSERGVQDNAAFDAADSKAGY